MSLSSYEERVESVIISKEVLMRIICFLSFFRNHHINIPFTDKRMSQCGELKFQRLVFKYRLTRVVQ